MLGKNHLIIAGLYGGVFLLPVNHPTLLKSYQIPIFNLNYIFVFYSVLWGAITPDFDHPNSLLWKVLPYAGMLFYGWFYEDEAERTDLEHRNISHRPGILAKIIIFTFSITIFALMGTYILQPLVYLVLPFLKPYSDAFELNNLLILFLVGFILGIFTHLLLDSTTKQGIFGGRYAGYIFVGSYAEEYARVLMILPGCILVIFSLISIFFNNWMLVYFLAGVSALIFVLLGILFRSRRFYELLIPTRICPHCKRLWIIKIRKRDKNNFWGHLEYIKKGSCKKGEDIKTHPIKYFPPTTRVILQLYLKLTRKDKG